MAVDFESAKAKITELATWYAGNAQAIGRSEADTRLHVIDRLLFECLGWNREDCTSEERYENTYTDYVLGRPERLIIVEAKKEGIYFELPAGFTRRTCKLRTITESDSQIEAAVRQAVGYCQERGVGIGVVCNGHQIIAFLASRQDGIPPLDGSAVVFPSLDAMRDHFRDVWDYLSAPGALARNLYAAFRADGVEPPPEKLSQRIMDYPGFKNRNPFQTELQILGEMVIEDVARAPELETDFLKKCYCPSGALSQYALISKQILQTRYSSLLEKELAAGTLEPVQAKSNRKRDLAADLMAATVKQRPIILLGDVGVGKTIFLRHLIKVDASDLLGKAIVLYIDFGREPALATDLQNFVLNRCSEQLINEYKVDIDDNAFVRGVYHFELQRFEQGIFAPLKELDPKSYLLQQISFLEAKKTDRAAHLRAALHHIARGRNTQVVVILDNIDQRPLEFQEQVFLIGQSLAEAWPATVFVSLRPDTFAQSRIKGSLTAYHPRVFTVAPPRVDLVVSRRLQFAMDELSQTGRLSIFPEGLSLDSALLTE